MSCPFEYYRPSAIEVWSLADRGRKLLRDIDDLDGRVAERHQASIEAVTDEIETPLYRSGVPVSRQNARFRDSVMFAQGALGLWAEAIWQFNDGSQHPRSITRLNAACADEPPGTEVGADLHLEHLALLANLDAAAEGVATMVEHGPSAEYVQLMVAHGALPLGSPLVSTYLERDVTTVDRVARAATTVRMFSTGHPHSHPERPYRVLQEELADLTPEELNVLFSPDVLGDDDLAALNEQLLAGGKVDVLGGLASTVWTAADQDTIQRLHQSVPALEPGLYGWPEDAVDNRDYYDRALDLAPAEPHLAEANTYGLDPLLAAPVGQQALHDAYEEVGLTLETLLARDPDWARQHITANANGTYTIDLDREFWDEWLTESRRADPDTRSQPREAVEVTVSGYVPAEVYADLRRADWVMLVQKAASPYAMALPSA